MAQSIEGFFVGSEPRLEDVLRPIGRFQSDGTVIPFTPAELESLLPKVGISSRAQTVPVFDLQRSMAADFVGETPASYSLTLTYKEGMNFRDFDRKVRALQDLANRGKLVKTPSVRNKNVTREYRENLIAAAERQWGQTEPTRVRKIEEVLETMHADHLHELQLGGVDHPAALWMLNETVNTSVGAQIQRQLRNVPVGTKINEVVVRGLEQ